SRDGDPVAEATVRVRVKGMLEHTAAAGNGPVNALDHALRKALEEFYPNLREMRLLDYKVRILDDHAVGIELEVGLVASKRTLHEQLERRLRALELEPLVLELLEAVEDAARLRRLLVEVDAVLARLPEDVGLAGQLRDQHAPVVAHGGGVDVLVGVRMLEHGRHMHAALVGEGGVAHV